MSDILSTSISGLLAFQRALDVTSNNVSNASTPGYSVENINLAEQPGTGTTSGYFGNGVNVAGVARAYDETLAAQVRSSNASYQSFNTLSTQASTIDNMLSASSTGLTATLQKFVNALQNVGNAPTSTAQRQVLVSQAQSLTQQLKSYQSQLETQGNDIEQQIGSTVGQINSLAKNIAQLNAQIAAAEGGSGGTGQTPNQLMDQRDKLVDRLSQYVSVSAVTESNGQMDVYIGSGQALVLASSAQQLAATTNPNDASELDIGLVSGNGTSSDVTSEITGGSLGGLLATRSQVLDPTINALGQVAVGIATLMNQQQAGGMDLTGAQGQPMFSIGPVEVQPAVTNVGNAPVNVTRTNLSQLTTDDYKLTFTTGGWQLQDTTTGQAVTMTGTGTSASPFQAAGMSIVINGVASFGDNYAVRPTAGAVDGMSVLTTQPSQIAAASLGQSLAASTNTGSGTISTPTVNNPAAWTNGTFTLTFTASNQYQVTDTSGNVVTSGPYNPGSPISFNGETVSISGSPAIGDTFKIGSNSAGNTGDNTNVLAMANALSSKSLGGGTTALNDAANNLVSAMGVLTQQAQANASAQQSVNQSATDTRNNLSGVNLDEEAAKMLQYQQAYQACAQMIQASNTIFNALITSIRG